VSYSNAVIREAEARADDEARSRDFRDLCESALIAMTPAELGERVAECMGTRTLYEMLSGQIKHDFLDAMSDEQLALFCKVKL
jgi:hypothetical protein